MLLAYIISSTLFNATIWVWLGGIVLITLSILNRNEFKKDLLLMNSNKVENIH